MPLNATICDGSGLIVFPSADGPELLACLGCDACKEEDTHATTAGHADLSRL